MISRFLAVAALVAAASLGCSKEAEACPQNVLGFSQCQQQFAVQQYAVPQFSVQQYAVPLAVQQVYVPQQVVVQQKQFLVQQQYAVQACPQAVVVEKRGFGRRSVQRQRTVVRGR